MPSGNITLTPGRVLGDETVTNDKLNDLGAPAARVDEAAITERELADEAFTGEKFADGAIGAEKFEMGDLDDGDYLLTVVDGVGSFKAYSDAVQFPIGAPFMWPSDTPPANCALLNGQILTRATYPICAALYAGLEDGEGNGTTTFALPDWRGIFPRGRPTGDLVGATGGTEQETLTIDQIPAHDHATTAPRGTDINTLGDNIQASNAASGTVPIAPLSEGGGLPHNNLPPYYNINYAVRLG